jgi:hypothetical protein
VLERTAETLSAETYALVAGDAHLRQTIVSVGLPILAPDGGALIRGPVIRIPEVAGASAVPLTPEGVEQWAGKGWVDLRPQNFERWRGRFQRMLREAQRIRGRGSAAITRQVYLRETIEIGEVVGWILNNEMGAYRIK